jgi:mannosylfructose-6-phosphate phosphatase
LLGDDVALERFARWLAPQREGVALAYSSGRLHWSIAEAMEQYPLPQPDFVVGGVGTEIRTGLHGDPWEHWTARFNAWDADLVRELLRERCGLRLQIGDVHTTHKISFVRDDLTIEELAEIELTLRDAGLDIRLIYSTSRDLDVAPCGAGKGAAARFLAEHLDIPVSHVIACGDSGNDVCMLKESGRAVVVANAFGELADLTGPTIYRSPHSYAGGVHDGVRHWLEHFAADGSGKPPSAECA